MSSPLPLEVWSRILPYAFDRMEDGFRLALVCRAFWFESGCLSFWSVWLERRKEELLELLRFRRPALFEVLKKHYMIVPFDDQWNVRELVQSKCPGFNEKKRLGCTSNIFYFEGEESRSGFGVIYYEEGDVYRGGLLGGLYHGHGTYIWQSGMIFEGNLAESFKVGDGKLIFTDGSCFVGVFEKYFDEESETDLTRGIGLWNDISVRILTTGNEWSPFFFNSDDQPLFRIEEIDDVDNAWGVLPSSGAPIERSMKLRQGTWEWTDRWNRRE